MTVASVEFEHCWNASSARNVWGLQVLVWVGSGSFETFRAMSRQRRLVSVATRRKWQLSVKSRKKRVSWMWVFVRVCYSRADHTDAITWHSSASLPSKKSRPVYLMQTATVHSSSTCIGPCSFFISWLSWKSCQRPVSSSDLCCNQVFEKLRGSLGVSWTVVCFLMMNSSYYWLKNSKNRKLPS